jgi:glycosyltransferase involved in cell wall biosynthesis
MEVSVIIPCYNRDQLLGATLNSLRGQTFPHWEAIIVDDDSKDNSVEVARQYVREDTRFLAVSRQGDRRGANICRNQGLRLARGGYIIFLDSDDLLSETCLEHRVAAMEKNPGCEFGVYQTELFTEAIGDRRVLWNAYTDSNDLHRFLSFDTVWLTTGPIWRKQAVMRLGGFDEDIRSLQDWAIHVQALINGMKYFKQPVRDNFHRHEYENAKTISGVLGIHPDHLMSHERLFIKTHKDLRLAGLLNHEVRCRVAGLFWWLANSWRRISNVSNADRIWRKACDLGLCRRHHYLEGRLIFRVSHLPGGGRLIRLMQWFWPRQYFRLTSEHLWKTPVGLTEPEAE